LIVVIKGFNTMIIHQNDIYINSTGNPALATAGSGDVLTGIITGLMAQGYEPLQSAIFGVYLHGKSADLLVQQMAYQSIIASDVIDGISNAYIDLFVEPEPTEQSSNGNHSEN
jgi:NAD(P)H-hydrate repair Nnr-like enzyme with NAD(P)H-hydrate dehydratase domain